MKKSLFALFALALAAVSAAAQVKIVTVNVQQCFDGYHKSVDFNDRLTSVQENFRNQARDRQAALQREAEPLQLRVQEIQENPGLSDAAKEEQLRALQPQIEAFQQKQQDFEAWVQEERQKAQQQSQNLRRTLIDDIKRHATEVGIKEGADLILDTSDFLNQGVPTVIFSSTAIDITNKVLAELNRAAPAQ
jgi:Skp family chaperone for outer membrane proteins